jgi:thiamine biosynthesis lipoprotein
VHRFRHHPLIGTVVDILVELQDGCPDDEAHRLDDRMVAEMVRLERVCSAFDPASELERWKRGEVLEPSDELCAVMAAALAFQVDSGGTFNPLAGVLTDAWRTAAAAGVPPESAELDRLAASIAAPRYLLDGDGRPVATGECAALQFNAFAKGWIVDRAIDVAWSSGVPRP